MKLTYLLLTTILFSYSNLACSQNSTEDQDPSGYELVWQDEFNEATSLPDSKWWFETGNHGWGNHELQNYVDRILGNDTVAKIENGNLIITA